MADRLSALLQRFELRARVGPAAAWRGPVPLDAGTALLCVLARGRLDVRGARGRRTVLPSAGVLLLPQAARLRAQATDAEGLVAAVAFGGGDENPVWRALPEVLAVPLVQMPALAPAHALLWAEAQARRCGHAAVLDRLAEVLTTQLLRHAIELQLVDGGLMAGLADARLHKALVALHADPARDWTLEDMAAEAGMSRARFAAQFAQRVGMPPGEYLTHWRLGLARALLRRGRSVKQVASEVGYGSASALGRVFTQRVGLAPTLWQQAQAAAVPA